MGWGWGRVRGGAAMHGWQLEDVCQHWDVCEGVRTHADGQVGGRMGGQL